MSDLYPRGSLVLVAAPGGIGHYLGVCERPGGIRHKVKLLGGRVRYVQEHQITRPMCWKPVGGLLYVARYAETIEDLAPPRW